MNIKQVFLSTALAAGLGALPGIAQQTDQQAPPPPPDQPYPQAGPQGQPSQNGPGWRKFGNPRSEYPPPADNQDPNQARPDFQGNPVPPPPAQLHLAAGTWITMRVNQPLSSDHNQPGDAFTGTLVQPLVAQGRVLAGRGQTIAGRVTDVEKHHGAAGHSKLGVEVTEIQLVDGQQVPVKTQLIERQGGTHAGANAAAIGTTTGVGAAIGAAVNGGVGAGVGAGAGLIVSTIGVLAAGGHPAVVYPEMVLTFRLESPITIEPTNDAFVPVNQGGDYQGGQRQLAPRYGSYGNGPDGPGYGAARPPVSYGGYYGGYPYPYAYGYPYGYPYYWGTGLYFYGGPRFYGGFRGGFRGGYRGGFRR